MPVYDPAGKLVLSHNPDGLRVELAFGPRDGRLELWISPAAHSDRGYWKRNFSNRDDHTRLFDAIVLPGLTEKTFVSCDYDPFHLVIHFERQSLHVVPLCDLPAVALWCDAPQSIDFKSDKQDRLIERAPGSFSVCHPDRGLEFQFIARVSASSKFRHQILEDRGRSLYARAELVPHSLLVIGGEESSYSELASRLSAVAAGSPDSLLTTQENKLKELLRPGTLTLHNQPLLQRIADTNRRVLAAMQDHQGAIRAALNRIYYLIWVRDGSMIEVFQAYAGNAGALRRWKEFLLANPTSTGTPDGRGRTFTMLVNPITKLEEDGVFHAVWSAFSDWTQRAVLPSADELTVLQDAVVWLEKHCWDNERGLFGRYYRCEDPLFSSLDSGFDNAVGNPSDFSDVRWQGQRLKRSYDIYINQYGYNAWLMLGMMLDAAGHPDEAAVLHAKAERLAKTLTAWPGRDRPAYGFLIDDNGHEHLAGAYGLDICDYEWALSVPPFPSNPEAHANRLLRLIEELERDGNRRFLAAYFSILVAIDPLDLAEERVLALMHRVAAECERPGQYLAMPFSMVEMTGVKDGDPYHDVRPQAFSAGPFLAALSNLGLRRLPVGLALRPTGTLASIFHYEFHDTNLNVYFSGDGADIKWSFDGEDVEGTWQIPSCLLRGGRHHRVEVVRCTHEVKPVCCWVASTVDLLSVRTQPDGYHYEFFAHGMNSIRLRHLQVSQVDCLDSGGRVVLLEQHQRGDDTWLALPGKGQFTLQVGRRNL